MNNPYIMPEDYLQGYRESAQRAVLDKNFVDVEKLCYQTFENNRNGKKLLEHLKKQFVYATTPGKIGASYDHACIYHEGIRFIILSFMASIESYKERVKHDVAVDSTKGDE